MAKKYSQGQNVTQNLSASGLNRSVDAAEAYANQKSTGLPSKESRFIETGVDIGVHSSLGVGNLPLGSVVRINDFSLTNVEREYLWFEVDDDGGDFNKRAFAVLLKPLKANTFGPARLKGVCPALVNVRDTTHLFAFPKDGETVLQSDHTGPVRIIHKPAGTGEKLCAVWIDEGQGTRLIRTVADDDGYPTQGVGTGANTYPFIFQDQGFLEVGGRNTQQLTDEAADAQGYVFVQSQNYVPRNTLIFATSIRGDQDGFPGHWLSPWHDHIRLGIMSSGPDGSGNYTWREYEGVPEADAGDTWVGRCWLEHIPAGRRIHFWQKGSIAYAIQAGCCNSSTSTSVSTSGSTSRSGSASTSGSIGSLTGPSGGTGPVDQNCCRDILGPFADAGWPDSLTFTISGADCPSYNQSVTLSKNLLSPIIYTGPAVTDCNGDPLLIAGTEYGVSVSCQFIAGLWRFAVATPCGSALLTLLSCSPLHMIGTADGAGSFTCPGSTFNVEITE